jgi:hypothetical protein
MMEGGGTGETDMDGRDGKVYIVRHCRLPQGHLGGRGGAHARPIHPELCCKNTENVSGV